MAQQNILLDSDIRDWVVLPLFVIMVAAGLLRFQVGNFLKPGPNNTTRIQQRAMSSLRYTATLKTGSIHFLSTSKIEARKAAYPDYLKQEEVEWCEATYDEQEEEKERQQAIQDDPSLAGENSPDNPTNKTNAAKDDDMPNPFAAMEGMKGNMAFMVQNMVMMQAIQHFFSGFILLKVPFQLTSGFKEMFQRGLQLATLDTSYVSSISWYFLVMFGLRGFFRLVIGTPSLETQETQRLWAKLGKQMGGPPPGQPGAPSDEKQAQTITTEAENLELLFSAPQSKHFKSQLDLVEKRLLQDKYPKKKQTLASDDFLFQQTKKTKTSKSRKQH